MASIKDLRWMLSVLMETQFYWMLPIRWRLQELRRQVKRNQHRLADSPTYKGE